MLNHFHFFLFLILGDNKLKFINGKAFAGLTKLTVVDFMSNQCIDEGFRGALKIAKLQQTLDEKCSFDEGSEDVEIKNTSTIISA